MKIKIPSFYGITRIDVNKKRGAVHAYRVSIRKRNVKTVKYFTDVACGGKRKALIEAKKYRDKIVKSIKPFTRGEISSSGKTKNKSGIVGVTLVKKIDVREKNKYQYLYWKAWWSPKVGVRKTAAFSVNKYGYKKAFELAKAAREKGLKSMKDFDMSFIKLSKRRSKDNIS